MAYLPLDFAAKPVQDREAAALELIERCGATPRKYRNGLALAIPSADQVEILRRETRCVLAIERVRKNAKRLNMTKEQQDELREREATHANALESAFLKVYVEVWLPKLVENKIGLEKIQVGGRPLQVTLNEQHQAMVGERTDELIMQVHRKVHDTLAPTKIIELFKLGEGTPPVLGIRCADVLAGFYSFLGFARLTSDFVVRRAILRGVNDGHFAYINTPSPVLGPDGKYQVPLTKLRYQNIMSEDEVDFDSGFLMLPQAIPQPPPSPAPVPGQPTPSVLPVVVPPPVAPSAIGQPGGAQVQQKQLDLSFTADRNQLFKVWNAVANLADMAGKVTVTLRAQSEKGFDKAKLNNGVLEPLREADLIQ